MEVAVDDSNFQKEVLEAELPVLVDFWAPWCGPCAMVSASVEAVGEEHSGRLKVCKCNVDNARETAVSYTIRAIPTLMLFKDGETVDSIIGAVPKEHINNMLDAVL